MFKYIIAILVLSSAAFATPLKNVQDGPACTLCTLVLTEAQTLLKNNATDQQILNFLETKLCAKLGPLAAVCNQLVAAEGPVIIQELTTLTPQQVCARLKLCSSNEVQKPKELKKVEDGPACQLCTLVLTEAQTLLKNNATDQQIINILETKLCAKLGPLAAICNQLVAAEGPVIIQELTTLTPQQVCARLKLCTSNEVQKPKELKEMTKVSAGPVCQLCTVVLTAAQTLLEQNKTEDQIINFLNTQLCGKLGSLGDICKSYVDEYGKLIIYELTQKIDPSIICNRIGLCSASLAVKTEKFGDANCGVCKLVFTEIVTELKTNATEAQIIQSIEAKLCPSLGNLAGLCKTLIEAFGPTIVNQLANGVDPAKVCQFLGLCPKTDEIKLVNTQYDYSIKENPVVCTACKFLVQYLDAEIKKNSSEANILNSLKNACKVLPQGIRADCDSLVTTYGTYIIQFLIQYADPNSICPALKLC